MNSKELQTLQTRLTAIRQNRHIHRAGEKDFACILPKIRAKYKILDGEGLFVTYLDSDKALIKYIEQSEELGC